ncbi:MAG: alpha-hydroxy acid oxidase [Deltaproteobacteria bacterium]|nr:alpha-hydroxy acid oxidase [Deltaproteobacteria bacterium]
MVTADKKLEELSLGEIRELARQRMKPEVWEHIMGSAESGSTQRRNQAALRRILFRQRIFHDVTNPDTTVELFGRRLSSPTVVAPVGSFSKIREGAEHEVAAGASRAGSMVFVSHAAKPTVREWTEGITAPLVFMGYLSKGREKVLENARLAEELGYVAVGLTMDVLQPTKLGDRIPLSTDGKPRKGHPASPKDIELLKREVSLPVVVKGIMNPDDARIALESGADTLVVSNHGGRLLDFNRAAIEALPEIVQAVGGKVPVLLDSGIRRGSDVVKALALGAKVVLLGRPICWGVGVGGARGVERVFQIITEEIKRVLIMTGVSSIAQVTESLLIRSQPVGPL